MRFPKSRESPYCNGLERRHLQMKLKVTTSNVFASVSAKGAVSLPPAFFNRSTDYVAKEVGALGKPVSPKRERLPLGVRMSDLSLEDQPTWARAHSWISPKGEITVDTVAGHLKAGRVQLLEANFASKAKGGPKFKGQIVLPADWREGQKLPKVFGVMPNATFAEGRIENYATRESDNRAIAANGGRRLSDWNLEILNPPKAKAKPEPKVPKAPKAK